MEYRCPGESIGHDDAICEAEAAFVSGANEAGYCSWVANFATLPPEAERFCTWLELGARFETSEVLWCSAGWPGPDRPPTPAEDPSLYCHWSLTFREGEVSAILEDYGFTQPFTCALGGLVSFNGENGTWDAERGVLTWSGVEYVPVN